jgi:hypothetical protein
MSTDAEAGWADRFSRLASMAGDYRDAAPPEVMSAAIDTAIADAVRALENVARCLRDRNAHAELVYRGYM